MSIIVEKDPDQLCLKGCMWTRNNIRDLIREKYGIDMKLSTLGYYLARWGFSVQRPVKRAYKQDQKQIDKWLNEEFPGITKRAEAENAEIFFGDETNIQNTANYMKGYAPKGKTPVVRVEAQKFKINMLSAISKRGKLRFMLYKENMDASKLIDFMGRLIRDTQKKVFLILDNLRVHHSKKVQEQLGLASSANCDISDCSSLQAGYGYGNMVQTDRYQQHDTLYCAVVLPLFREHEKNHQIPFVHSDL